MLAELFQHQQRSLSHFYAKLNLGEVHQVVEQCFQTQGLIVITGVGKSGIIAEKIAMTLISTGTKALYIPAMNFLHGDIGILSSIDCLMMLSKSGETEELLSLIPFVRKRKTTLISLISNPQSQLAKQSDLSVMLPVDQELCPFDLAPTISTEVQLLFGDVLAIALMKKRGISLQEYGANHPSGAIGKKVTLQVKELMIPLDQLALNHPSDQVKEILPHLSEKKLGCVLIVDQSFTLQGIFTDGDLRRALQNGGPSVMEEAVERFMTQQAITIESEELAWDALKKMQKKKDQWIMALPVIKEGSLVGLIRMHDIIHAGIS
ncbi:MAG: KpsF/GutQ family sugar-phosphate isomerase [Candidatus Rhabdochlamydia sp.]